LTQPCLRERFSTAIGHANETTRMDPVSGPQLEGYGVFSRLLESVHMVALDGFWFTLVCIFLFILGTIRMLVARYEYHSDKDLPRWLSIFGRYRRADGRSSLDKTNKEHKH
jgi:hypothetical protein